MEEEDRDINAENFSEALFTYLWFTENLISGSTAAESVGEMSDFIADAAKAVVVLSALTVPSFNQSMEGYFKRNEMTRRSVFTFLTVYCFKNHEETDDIFAVVLNTCTFVYRLVIFCQHRGHVEYIEFASMCWNEIYEVDIKDEFYARGGWDEFKNYVAENRYVPTERESEHKVFLNFLEEINYLFPKLDVKGQKRYTHMFSPAAALAELEAATTVGLLASALTPNNLKAFGQSDDSHVVTEDAIDQVENQSSSDDGIAEFCGDSDEELFQELVRVGLDSISKVHMEGPALDCIVCQNENGLRTTSLNDLVCPKHHPDSFYYLVTNAEDDNLFD